MTKTLTEQWREGTLDERIRYYFRFPKGRVLVRSIHSVNNLKKMERWDKIECLDAVPSYEDYLKLLNESYKLKLLEKQLKIAKEALNFYSDPLFMEQGETARKALKEMEEIE